MTCRHAHLLSRAKNPDDRQSTSALRRGYSSSSSSEGSGGAVGAGNRFVLDELDADSAFRRRDPPRSEPTVFTTTDGDRLGAWVAPIRVVEPCPPLGRLPKRRLPPRRRRR